MRAAGRDADVEEGIPAGLKVTDEEINKDLARRQGGYGRGGRMLIEKDEVDIRSGIRWGETLGSPIALGIENRDWKNWTKKMSAKPEDRDDRIAVTKPRPGHADLNGVLKYDRADVRDILERASARETAARVAAGSLARQLLARFNIHIASHVSAIGDVALPADRSVPFTEAQGLPDDAPLRCVDVDVQARMMAFIDAAKDAGDTVGGAFEVIASGVPPGLGTYAELGARLDARLFAGIPRP